MVLGEDDVGLEIACYDRTTNRAHSDLILIESFNRCMLIMWLLGIAETLRRSV